MVPNSGDLGEQALGKLAEAGISSQLDEVEDLDVNIKADPLKVVQGQVDAVAIEGKGLVMQGDLRMEEMTLQTGAVAVNPLSTVFGKIELTRPTEASAQVVLTEEDVNRAFNSDFVRDKIKNLKIAVDGHLTPINLQNIEFRLPGAGKVGLKANVAMPQAGDNHSIDFTAAPKVSANKRQILLDDLEYSQGGELSPEISKAMLTVATDLLDLRNFEMEGMILEIDQLQVDAGKMTLAGNATIEKFPSS